jgi:putative glutamine amidotransferase
VARAPDGIIEAIEARGYSWVAGVQWHPEAMARTDPVQMRLFECFAQACNLFAEMELHAEELDSA